MEVQIEADSVGHDLAFGWSRFNRGVHTPPSVLEGLAQGEAVRQGMAPDPELPDDGDAQFAEGQIAEDEFAEDELSRDGGPGEPLSAQDNQEFAALTSELDQPAEAATPF
jgi:hypothetical protein